MRHTLLGLLVLGTGMPAAARAQDAVRTQVEAAVRAYVAAENQADAGAAAAAYSMQPGVTAIADGQVQRGWDQIRRRLGALDSLAQAHHQLTVTLESVDVTPLGKGYALAVAPYTRTVAGAGGVAQQRGAMTLVLQQVSGNWKIIHAHTSLVPPLPPAAASGAVAAAPGAAPPAAAGAAAPAPAAGGSTIQIVSADVQIPAQQVTQYAFQIPAGTCTVTGRAEGIAGGDKDFQVLILDDDNYRNWNAGLQSQAYGSTGRVTVANINTAIPGPGTYHLVISNALLPPVAKTVQVTAQARCP